MMRALVKAHAGPGLEMQRLPVPEIGPDDVLIRINKTGICGTDIHIWNWDDWAAKTVPVPLVTAVVVSPPATRTPTGPITLLLPIMAPPVTQ